MSIFLLTRSFWPNFQNQISKSYLIQFYQFNFMCFLTWFFLHQNALCFVNRKSLIKSITTLFCVKLSISLSNLIKEPNSKSLISKTIRQYQEENEREEVAALGKCIDCFSDLVYGHWLGQNGLKIDFTEWWFWHFAHHWLQIKSKSLIIKVLYCCCLEYVP